MIFDARNYFLIQRRRFARETKCAIARMPPGPSSNLGQFGWRQLAVRSAIEFANLRKRHMVNIHIQSHANCIGRHQIIDGAGLIELDLRIARARAESAHNNRGAAFLLANNFGQCINIFDRKGGNGRSTGQARQLFHIGPSERREATAGFNVDVGK